MHDLERFESLVSGDDHPLWNQSWYYQLYDPASRVGAFVRIGLQENRKEANSWLVVFRDGRPLFTRTNLNLPYTSARPRDGIDIAGMRIHAEVPLKRTRVSFETADFSLDLTWSELAPMADCISMSQDRDGSFARESAHMRMIYDGTRWLRVRSSEDRLAFDREGFAITGANWTFVDELDRRWEFHARPIFDWLYPMDAFVLREQLCEFRLADGTLGYGLHETGFRLPWTGLEESGQTSATANKP